MKASHFALVTLILGLAVGFAIGAVLNGSDPTAAAPRTVGLDRSSPVIPNSAPLTNDASLGRVGELPSTGDITSASTHRSTVPAPGPGPGARSAARKAISMTRPDGDEAPWTHEIHGAVLDADGDPMPGVQVVCMNRDGNGWLGRLKGKESTETGRAWKGLPDVEASLAERAKELLDDRRNASTAISDTTGGFALEGLREGVHLVQAYADGYEFAPQTVHTGRECTLVGGPVVELEFDVRLPDGTQPATAVIFPGSATPGSELAWSPEEPRIRMKEAAFELVIRSGHVQRVDWRTRSSDYESELRTIDVNVDGAGPHVVELRAKQILRVRIDDASELIPKLPVWVKMSPATADPEATDWSDEAHTVLSPALSGDFEVSGMPRGKYLLAAGRGKGNAPELTQNVALGEGVTETTLALGEAELQDFLIVSCTRSGGAPVDKVKFSVESGKGRFTMPGRVTHERRARGEFWISRGQLFDAKEGQQSRDVRLTATSTIDGAVSLPVERDQGAIEFEFEPARSIEVLVHGDLAAGYSVQALPLGDDGSADRSPFAFMIRGTKKVNDEGRAVLTSLQPGAYEVTLYQTGHDTGNSSYVGNSRRVATEKVTVKGTDQELNLTVPASHTVMVHAEGQEAGRTLQLSPKASKSYRDRVSADVGQDSMARFNNVFEGEYTLQLEGSPDTMTITVPTGEVQFVAKIIYALKVRSVKEGGAAALAGFKSGDLITEFNGQPVGSWGDMARLSTTAASAAAVVTVQRDQQSVGLTIGPLGEEDGKPKSIGMRLTVATK